MQHHELPPDEPDFLLVHPLNCPENPDDGHRWKQEYGGLKTDQVK